MATAQNHAAVLTARFNEMTDPADVQAYVELAGYQGLQKATGLDAAALLNELETARLISRSGSGENIAAQWQALAKAKGQQKYIVCNANEGEPGSFKDKALIQKDPLAVIEGMTIAAYFLKATQGYLYLQGEFPDLIDRFATALTQAKAAHYLGTNILGIPDFNFDIQIMVSGGGYVADFADALIPALEGQVGKPGRKVNLVKRGLNGAPTLVHDPETFANIPVVFRLGGSAYHDLGVEDAGGTILVSLSGQFQHPGLYEVNLGTPVQTILYQEDYGGGSATGKPFKFIHVGGQAGALATPTQLEASNYTYSDFHAQHLTIGRGVLVAMDDSIDVVDYLEKVAEFYCAESCGKCLAGRVGSVRIKEQLQKFQRQGGVPGDLSYFAHTVDHVAERSLCPVGQSIGNAIFSGMKLFPDEFKQGINWDAAETKEVPW